MGTPLSNKIGRISASIANLESGAPEAKVRALIRRAHAARREVNRLSPSATRSRMRLRLSRCLAALRSKRLIGTDRRVMPMGDHARRSLSSRRGRPDTLYVFSRASVAHAARTTRAAVDAASARGDLDLADLGSVSRFITNRSRRVDQVILELIRDEGGEIRRRRLTTMLGMAEREVDRHVSRLAVDGRVGRRAGVIYLRELPSAR